jgi:DNA-binding NarL/FixJ family response regulator
MASQHGQPLSSEVYRIVVADDHELARTGLIRMLEGEPDLAVVGEADRGTKAVALCAELQPDLVLMDVRMPEMDGLTATGEIHRRSPRTAVLIVTLYEQQEYLVRAIRAGASGYLLKDATRAHILSVIRKVLGGESAIDPSMTMRVLQSLLVPETTAPERQAESLTQRETEVLELLVEGYTNHEIAARLRIGTGTVKSHVEHIISKLGASGRTQAAVMAVQHGLVALQPSA